MKIIYFADGPWAHLTFDRIIEKKFKIDLVVLRNDKRDRILLDKANNAGIECTWVRNVNDSNFLSKIRLSKIDLGVSMSFNQIFKQEIIDTFPLGIVNCHAGKLPQYRGRNVLNWALINGEDEIGVTCHYVDQGIDTGDIIHQKTFPVTESDDYGTVLDKAYKLCADVLIYSIELIRKGEVKRRSQKGPGTYYIGRKTGDEFINWEWRSRRIFNFVRAITSPGPNAQSWIEIGQEYHPIYLKKVALVEKTEAYICVPGSIVGKSKKKNPLIKTGDTLIELLDYEIDHPKKTKLAIGDRLGINFNLQMIWNSKRVF